MTREIVYPFEPLLVRRALKAWEIIKRHGLQDEFWAEVRATVPQAREQYLCWGGDAHHAHDLAQSLPGEFGTPEQIEPLAREHVAGSRRKFYLLAMEKVAKLADLPPVVEQVEDAAEPDPPPPPADWTPSYQVEQVEQPIVVKAASEVHVAVRLAQARKAAGK